MGWERGHEDTSTNTINKYTTNTPKTPSTVCTILEIHHGHGDEQQIELDATLDLLNYGN